jgi:hypothetical protein
VGAGASGRGFFRPRSGELQNSASQAPSLPFYQVFARRFQRCARSLGKHHLGCCIFFVLFLLGLLLVSFSGRHTFLRRDITGAIQTTPGATSLSCFATSPWPTASSYPTRARRRRPQIRARGAAPALFDSETTRQQHRLVRRRPRVPRSRRPAHHRPRISVAP